MQGRDKDKAQIAALIYAFMQGPEASAVTSTILKPLELEMTAAKTERAEKAAATKVDFFTMVRGEDT